LADSNSNSNSIEDIEYSNNGEEKRVPATGWNHNQPKEDSNFWQKSFNGNISSEKQQRQRQQESSSSASSSSSGLRTGWLHGSVPAQKSSNKAAAAAAAAGGQASSKTGAAAAEGSNKAQQRLRQAMQEQERNHRIVSHPTFHACDNDRQIVVTEHALSVPVNHDGRSDQQKQQQPRIDLAFTIVENVPDEATRKWFRSLGGMTPSQRAKTYITKAALKNADGMVLYLQGGPGFGAPAPVVGLGFSKGSSWGAAALDRYQRVVLMDQRGTGKSTPITKQSLEERFPNLFVLDDRAEAEADANNNIELDLKKLESEHPEDFEIFTSALEDATNYMASFRADNIVKVSFICMFLS